MWTLYRLKSREKDFRPIISNPKYPWWKSGSALDDSYVIIHAYLPTNVALSEYWPDAFDVTHEDHEKIEFTTRFPRPKYFVD